ncbi:hypothetical protein SRABI96_00345 [Peribacillus sp. Bi96]|uniref:hypothetical protein n=1 Tax=Peribacillus sp. Bi96 TaxID=2884273 RepID=UPI001DA40E60|nr:hypothetical protein [Peribacillus sp. Bi96]CAH0135469.1 hypothetical protein SRABI96_00345 [Peribacillus sp. Bi96]
MGNTTNMLIEHLVNGFHFFVALVLLLLCILDVGFFKPFFTFLTGSNKDILVAIYILFLPFVYTLGIIIDHFVDDIIFNKREFKIRNEILQGKSSRQLIMLTNDQNQASQLDSIRTKIRITRTTSFNFAIISIFSLALLLTQFTDSTHFFIILFLIILVGPTLSYLSYWSWRQNTVSFCKRVVDGYKMYEEKNKEG